MPVSQQMHKLYSLACELRLVPVLGCRDVAERRTPPEFHSKT